MRLLTVLLSLSCASAAAQDWTAVPANESQFSGYWRITLIPNEAHKSSIKNEQTGYDHPCQFFIHLPNGDWKSLTVENMAGEAATKARCPTKRSELEPHLLATGRTAQRWKKLSAQDGLFVVSNQQTGRSLLWKADFVVKDIPASNPLGMALKKGDLIMQVSKMAEGNRVMPMWPMILQPVRED